ncbi:MAG: peptide-methionine (R)-S-oxide reductase MsrB [Cyclobacteriaceae bacterium]
MNRVILIVLCLMCYSCNNFGQAPESNKEKQASTMSKTELITKTESEWKAQLTSEQFYILREKGTERPFTGKYYKTNDKGVYSCAACGNELFTSEMKFDSECGWPSFDREILGDRIKTQTDLSHGMIRTEIMCAKCGGHLGHLFDDGPTETGKRYCVNSVSLNFVKAKE